MRVSTVTEFAEGATPNSYDSAGAPTADFQPAVGTETHTPQAVPAKSETAGYRAEGGGIRASIRDLIQKARPYSKELVEVPEWGVTIEVRSISLGLRNEMMLSVIDEETKQADIRKLYPEMIIACSYDPETGDKVFAADDAAFLNGLDAGILDKIAKPALSLSGMSDDAKDKEAGKSSETETSVSPS